MRRFPAPLLALLAFAPLFAVFPCKAASSAKPAQAGCTTVNLNNKDTKFTGQISSGPNGSLFEVTSGSDTVLVRYNNSVPVCEGGQATSVGALSLGATVVVYGPTKRKGKVTEMDAVNIVLAGPPAGAMRNNDSMTASFSVAASQGRGGSQSSGAIACDVLLFSVTSTTDPSGRSSGRSTVVPIICKRPVDQMTPQMMQDVVQHRRIPVVTLNWQNQLEATLHNAEITSVQILSDNGTLVVEITYSSQGVMIVHVPSGNRVEL